MRWSITLSLCVDVRRGLPIGKVKSSWFSSTPSQDLSVCVDGDIRFVQASFQRIGSTMPEGQQLKEGSDHAEHRVTLLHVQAKSLDEADRLYAALKIAI